MLKKLHSSPYAKIYYINMPMLLFIPDEVHYLVTILKNLLLVLKKTLLYIEVSGLLFSP